MTWHDMLRSPAFWIGSLCLYGPVLWVIGIVVVNTYHAIMRPPPPSVTADAPEYDYGADGRPFRTYVPADAPADTDHWYLKEQRARDQRAIDLVAPTGADTDAEFGGPNEVTEDDEWNTGDEDRVEAPQ
jgi:hypothetical protein